MIKPGKMLDDLKWSARQRMQYIEIMAYYTGAVSRSDVARAFGLSDAAATKDLKLYSDLLPGNLMYKQSVFGFVPTENFFPGFGDMEPAEILPIIASNLATAGGPYSDHLIYGITTEDLPLPIRLPKKEVVAQIIRAIRHKKKLEVEYLSMSSKDKPASRVIEPHSLINNGLRWHIRAYNNETYDFRDFVLARFKNAYLSESDAESSQDYDDDWIEKSVIKLRPHPGLSEAQRFALTTDYAAKEGVIEIEVRRALIGYLLQRLSVDTSPDHSRNPSAHQLIVTNRDEVEPYASWAFE